MRKLLLILLFPLVGFGQFNPVAFYEYGKQKAIVNTFIGGIGGTINTPTLLANRLNVSVGRIKLFSVIGSDVQCAIIGSSYSFGNEAAYGFSGFNTSTGITYFRDIQGLVLNLGFQAFYNTPITEVYMPNLLTIGSSAFDQNSAGLNTLKKLYIPKVTNIGLTVGNDDVFRTGNVGGGKIYVHPNFQTVNSGGVEGDIAYLATGNTVRYVTNFTAPNPVTTLMASTIYNTAVKLTFTPPSGTNAIDYYEVYVNGEYKGDIASNVGWATGLTQNTAYSVYLISVDIFQNKSSISNILNVTTSNSTEDVDAVAYTTASNNFDYFPNINTLFTSLKSASLYAKIQAFYPFLGTTSTQQKYNGKNPIDADSAYRLTFNGSGTFSDLGYQCNGTNAYANTHLSPSAVQDLNNNGVTITCGTNNTAGTTATEIGSFQSPNGTFLAVKRVSGGRKDFCSGTTLTTEVGINESRCILTGIRLPSNVTKMFKNGALIGTGTGSGTLSTLPYDIGRLSSVNGQYSNQRIQFTAIHEGLSDAEIATFHSIIDTFENSLGRKTW